MTNFSIEWMKAIQKTDRLLKMTKLTEQDRIVYFLKILLLKKILPHAGSGSPGPDRSDSFILQSAGSISWDDLLKSAFDHAVQTGEKLDRAFEQITGHAPELKETITGSKDFSFNDLNDTRQINNKIIKTVSDISIESDQIYGEIADYIIRTDFSLNKKYGFNLNPPFFAQLMAGCINLEPGMKLYDIDCKDGKNFIECSKMMDTKNEDQNIQYFGFSQGPFESTICLLNLALHNIPLSSVSLSTAKKKISELHEVMAYEKLFPCHRILGNYLSCLTRQTSKKDQIGSISELIKLLTPDGMIAFILPQRMLAGRQDAGDRTNLVKTDMIESVIHLPTSFSSCAGIDLYLVTIRAEKLLPTKNKILFIDLADFFRYTSEKEISSVRTVEIIIKYRNFIMGLPDQTETVLSRFSRVVSTDDVEKSNFILTIQRYVAPPADQIDIEEGFLELQIIQKRKEELKMEMDMCLKNVVKMMKGS